MILQLDELKWGESRTGETVSRTMLYPGDEIIIEADWVVSGPQVATIIRSGKRTRVLSNRLPKYAFNIDDPLEYPCKVCGAQRGEVCLGEKADCTYRVFHTNGGIL